MPWRGGARPEPDAALHAAIYAQRPDVGAVALGGGVFGLRLADFGGAMPGVFDEQVRHLGCMGPAVDGAAGLEASLRDGGNVVLVGGLPACLGTTGSRLALNAELFEKCAKAYVLAVATGGRVKPLPWLVRHVANGRLMKDERRARQRFSEGLLPEEARGY
jgi:ribulose-5-phosphate 4-epimerase/fuculose-1-phosphate aldolase